MNAEIPSLTVDDTVHPLPIAIHRVKRRHSVNAKILAKLKQSSYLVVGAGEKAPGAYSFLSSLKMRKEGEERRGLKQIRFSSTLTETR